MHPVDQRLLPESRWDFSDLNAVFINPTLKRSPAPSNPQALAPPVDRDHAPRPTSAARSTGPSITTSRLN
jgi:hypothetical protein